MRKEAWIVAGHQLGATMTCLAGIIGLDVSTFSRRHDADIRSMRDDPILSAVAKDIVEIYHRNTI